jgi:hypothetical protein
LFHLPRPDSKNRLTQLRFDTEAGAKQDLGEGRFAIVPVDPARSEMMRRITASDPEMRMPPVASGHNLNAGEIDQVRRWIEQGAPWQQHWAWIPPKRPARPQSSQLRLVPQSDRWLVVASDPKTPTVRVETSQTFRLGQ